ncbi:TerC family protein [Robertkochia solimangrovi]|uniref:TerC family protein n=1 Tax=Robertkochia solimangrovi TaxID=2213046 RepID=UPI00117CFE74|nr:TerC family protein [Robertkochia solimangrovi]TRZ45342.1 hypothetical protein DMZ48_06250 [Robertkochia solimangrovi]
MIVWSAFIVLIIVFLALDLGVFNSKAHEITNKEATIWTIVWVSVAMLFSLAVYAIYKNDWLPHPTSLTPNQALIKYITGYLVELSLSVDNIFVIAVIFTSFRVPKIYQHRVLFWGILGAVIFRSIMIFFGVFLIRKFSWATYVFGAFLIITAIRMLFQHQEETKNFKNSNMYKFIRNFIPITKDMYGQKFIIKRKGVVAATPLFAALLIIEFTDILFAVDSIPAILAITPEPFIVFTSNIMAVLGLRSMYFFLANMLGKFHYLKYSLVVILAFVGIKMIISHKVEIGEIISLGVIIASLAGGILFSKWKQH